MTGTAAKNFAVFVAAVLRDQKRTRGKTNLTRLLRAGKPLKFFSVPEERMREFTQEAKRHGLLFVPMRDRTNPRQHRDRHLGGRRRQSRANHRPDAAGRGADGRG